MTSTKANKKGVKTMKDKPASVYCLVLDQALTNKCAWRAQDLWDGLKRETGLSRSTLRKEGYDVVRATITRGWPDHA